MEFLIKPFGMALVSHAEGHDRKKYPNFNVQVVSEKTSVNGNFY
jgi:hypothetical protein